MQSRCPFGMTLFANVWYAICWPTSSKVIECHPSTRGTYLMGKLLRQVQKYYRNWILFLVWEISSRREQERPKCTWDAQLCFVCLCWPRPFHQRLQKFVESAFSLEKFVVFAFLIEWFVVSALVTTTVCSVRFLALQNLGWFSEPWVWISDFLQSFLNFFWALGNQ